jgi:hypothetical protein
MPAKPMFKKYPLNESLPVMDKKILSAYFSKMGKRGARTNKKKGKAYWAELSRKGVLARLKNKHKLGEHGALFSEVKRRGKIIKICLECKKEVI